MSTAPRPASRFVRLTCLLLLLLALVAVATPRTASACLPFGTYQYYNCQGQYLATCWVTNQCKSCCTGPITGWCTRTHTPGNPSCDVVPD